MKRLILILLAISLSAAVWDISDATGQLCFGINATEAMTGATAAWYDVAVIALPVNGTFWEENLQGYHPGTSVSINVFPFAGNGTHRFVMIPLQANIASGYTDEYCLYSGGSNLTDISEVAPYGYGFDSSLTGFTPTSYSGSCTYSISGGILNISSATDCYLDKDSTPAGSPAGITLMLKMKKEEGGSLTTSAIGSIVDNGGAPYTSGYGIGIYGAYGVNFAHAFNTATNVIDSSNSSWSIVRGEYKTSTYAAYSGYVYNENYTWGANNSTVFNPTGYYAYTYLAYVRNASALFDWSIAFDRVVNQPFAQDIVFDYMSSNITILAPLWGTSYEFNTVQTSRVRANKDFDNCSVYMNDVLLSTHSLPTNGDILSDSLVGFNGTNNITVRCYDSGYEEHSYSYFSSYARGGIGYFEDAFDMDVTALCNGTVINQLTPCFEYYRLRNYYNFSAVVCYNLNMSYNYSCLGLSNATKNSYTVFYAPSTWGYNQTQNVQHIGADFYYGGGALNAKMELYANDSFVYIPAQTKERDCGIYYTSASYCSYWAGFTLNRYSVFVADKNNNWYTTGGRGIPDFTSNYSQLVVNTEVLYINNFESDGATGMFTRFQCNERNGYYNISLTNTLSVYYEVYVLGNASYSYNQTTYSLGDSISTTGVTDIFVYADNSLVCYYTSSENIFLPPAMDLDWLAPGLQNFLIKVLLLFIVVVSSVIPHAIIGALLLNDVYHVLTVGDIAFVAVLAVVTSLINNAHSVSKGIKNILLMAVIVSVYLSAVAMYQSYIGIDLTAYQALTDSALALKETQSLPEMIVSAVVFIINVATFVLLLPLHLTNLIIDLLGVISPVIKTSALGFVRILQVGAVLYLYLKFYEIVTNRFRDV